MTYIDRIESVASNDVHILKKKDAEYGGSWLKRGGIGAFMMLARKWDRLETAMECDRPKVTMSSGTVIPALDRYDIIGRAVADSREEGILDDIADLRRYLLLVEAEIRTQISK